MLGKLSVPGRPTNLDYSRARACCAAVVAGGGCLDIFSLIYHFSLLSQRAVNQQFIVRSNIGSY